MNNSIEDFIKSKTKEELIREVFEVFKEEVSNEENEVSDLYHEIKHILYLNRDLKEIEESDFIESDFDEINDMLFNKIKNILIRKTYTDLNNILSDFKLKITKEKLNITEEELKEKILRIVIVLLHDQEKDDDQIIIRDICKNLKLSYNLKDDIKKFYEFTTGKNLII